jgi:hypothetical protein
MEASQLANNGEIGMYGPPRCRYRPRSYRQRRSPRVSSTDCGMTDLVPERWA